jgi:two-component system, chemotaxis family, protein-glutamate methylesterase/glutaminase
MHQPIRVMLVDDSRVARSVFTRVLESHADIEVVAAAEDSEQALIQLGLLQVDIILLDIEMPRRSGIDALPDILAAAGNAKILVVSSFAEKNGPAALQALSLGACDTLAKPGRIGGVRGGFSDALLDKVIRLGKAPTSNTVAKFGAYGADLPLLAIPKCIAIGASTGGIPVIFEIVKNLDPALQCPIFIVQHLPEAFMDFFARQLRLHTDRPVSVAVCGEVVQNGHIYVAPGNAHLVCRKERGRVYLDHMKNGDISRYCPSVDVLLGSVARTYGSDALAIVLSGMGNDGTSGSRELAARGGAILVQDEASSVVWGMPGSIAKEELATAILSPENIWAALAAAVAR